ncbi:hypothetical protein UFOVP847_43 [uncultured Caudovirales phage]|uniref:Uncharacterized protein n=1 Tax=uncultured Caudovirales phage TaxID=2100421 RepID=A0A6J5PG48_9CAUD|nr:hypothetical protein UFOVP847_43 [uncultured Caudovirales phage]
MSDLIKRDDALALLNSWTYCCDAEDAVRALPAVDPAAIREAALQARIEELEAACWRMQEDRDRAIGWRDHNWTRADTAEAKLAKAKAYLQKISRHANRSCAAIAAHALAELDGGE